MATEFGDGKERKGMGASPLFWKMTTATDAQQTDRECLPFDWYRNIGKNVIGVWDGFV
jgi:hypothetical protein